MILFTFLGTLLLLFRKWIKEGKKIKQREQVGGYQNSTGERL